MPWFLSLQSSLQTCIAVRENIYHLSLSTNGNLLLFAENEILYKRGGSIMVGDHMLGEGSHTYVVTSISNIEKAGLYNPFTLGGTIIVNGMVVSTHSEWFLDAAFDFLGWEYWLPAAYQMVLFPVRLLYRNLGKELYISLYHQLDALVDIAATGTSYGASLFAGMGTSFAIIVALLLSKGVHSLSSSTIGKKC
jgi:desert hedgehog protein